MSEPIDAIYENGLFRPLVPLNIPDQERVSLIVQQSQVDDGLDRDALQTAETEGDSNVSLMDVRRRMASIPGSFADSVILERGEY